MRNLINLELENFLPYRISILANQISHGVAKLYQNKYKLKILQWRVIAVLSRYPNISANQVSHYTVMDKVAVSRAVSQLLTKKLVMRQLAKNDRRKSVLCLTEIGIETYQNIAPQALNYQDMLCNCLNQDDLNNLDMIFTKLSSHLKKMNTNNSKTFD